jgi:hypothetical protein
VKWEEYTKTENEKLRLVTYIVSDDWEIYNTM